MNKNFIIIGITLLFVGVISFITSFKMYEMVNNISVFYVNLGWESGGTERILAAHFARYGLGIAGGAVGLVLLLAGLLRGPEKS